MTTTAEKIKVMQAFENGAQIEAFTYNASARWYDCKDPEWDWSTYDYRSKPPDPKPLECWVNVMNDTLDPYTIEQCAKSASGRMPMGSVDRTAVHMREVTPQDEHGGEAITNSNLIGKTRGGIGSTKRRGLW